VQRDGIGTKQKNHFQFDIQSTEVAWSAIRKSGYRFSEKHALGPDPGISSTKEFAVSPDELSVVL
jgi:hypothetical protein